MTGKRAHEIGTSEFRSNDVGLRADVMRGWYDAGTGEICPGFPVGPGDTVADIGCGDGGASIFCTRMGARVILADIDAPRLERTRARLDAMAPGRVSAIATDAAPIPLPDASVTRVVCMEVIEHVDDPAVLLGELFRILAPGGLLLLACPHWRSEGIQQVLASDFYFMKPNHVRIVGEGELAAWTRRAGFAVEREAAFGFYQTMWWSLFWIGGNSFEAPHPVLERWAQMWEAVLDLPEGRDIQGALDAALPKTQMLVARRPQG